MNAGANRPDDRLMMCASFVRRGKKVADIGTDHAYLPVWLCRSGICPAAVAADVNPEPLERGRRSVRQAGLEDKISLRLSDGLKEIAPDEAEDIVIAGMGGELITKIIDDCGYSRDGSRRFILQPMTKSELLIEWLDNNGFEILRQDCCTAAGKCYTVLSAAYTGSAPSEDGLFYYMGRLDPKANPLHRRFIEQHIERLKKKSRGDAKYAELAEKLKDKL